MFLFKETNSFIQQGHIKWIRSNSIHIYNVSVSNKCYSIHQRILMNFDFFFSSAG